MEKESPDYLRTSLAGAMTLGFKGGVFYRNAKSPCLNLLLTYDSGCAGNCSYCGLSRKRPGSYNDKSFIRVEWPSYKLTDIILQIQENFEKIKRICISMITNKRAVDDTIIVTKMLKDNLNIPISLLISPTLISKNDLMDFKNNGADMIGIAVDVATKELFEKHRGKGVNGPHEWEKYWKCFGDAVKIFGNGMVGVHLIVGLGETEKEMTRTIQRVYDFGGSTHLFSFFPEANSQISNIPQSPMGQYRRIQLARYLIDEGIASVDDLLFDSNDRIKDLGISNKKLIDIIESGLPFMTSGCPDKKGNVACNRPYGNCYPGPNIRNFPFVPDKEDIRKIKLELWEY